MHAFLLFVLTAFSSTASAEPRPWSASVEVLGRSVAFGLKVDRAFEDRWAAGFGLARSSTAGSSGQELPATALIPLYVNRYFAPEPRGWYVTGGLTLIANPGDVEGQSVVVGSLRFPSYPVIFSAGGGYELRQAEGFLLRAELLVQRGATFAPALGFSLGYAL
jgi:hypothetical protein